MAIVVASQIKIIKQRTIMRLNVIGQASIFNHGPNILDGEFLAGHDWRTSCFARNAAQS